MTRYDLPNILYKAITDMGGQTNIIDVCKYVWEKYEEDLRQAGDLFYSWQYDIRWAATELRKSGRMKAAEVSPRGIWETI
jgi:hypothetical protein